MYIDCSKTFKKCGLALEKEYLYNQYIMEIYGGVRMFNITICYKDNYLKNINEEIKNILNKSPLSEKFKINTVHSGIDLLKSFSEEGECNILFLEEELVDLKGVSIIDLIRKYNEDIKIVIITKDDEIKKIYSNYTVINKYDIFNKLEYIIMQFVGKNINDKNEFYLLKNKYR